MFRPGLFARGACISAFVLLTAGPAFAGDDEAAQRAISAAGAKIDAANKVGASGEAPATVARAQAELSQAKEDLRRGHERRAFDEATHAGQLADTAIGTAEQSKLQAERDQRASAEVAASAAQQDAADANARAASAEQAAAMAAADAAAARATPPPAPTTTVTTVQKSSRVAATSSRVVKKAPAKKRTTVVRRAAPATVASEETTTTVTTNASGQ